MYQPTTLKHPQPDNLDARRVQHDAQGGAHGLGRQVGAKRGTDGAVVAVRAADAAPDDTVLGAFVCGLGNLLPESVYTDAYQGLCRWAT
jgi:hypothetical protein